MILASLVLAPPAAAVALLLCSGPTSLEFAGRPAATAPTAGTGLVAGRFDQDDHVDLAATGRYDDAVRIYLGDGRGRFRATMQELPTGPGPVALASGDFDADGLVDLVAAESDGLAVSVFLGGGVGYFTGRIPTPIDREARGVEVGDLDSDGRLDLVVTYAWAWHLSLLRGRGDGRFGSTESLDIGTSVGGLAIADVDADGVADLVFAGGSSPFVGIGLGDGLGRFTRIPDLSAGGPAADVVTGDVDEDGRLDWVARLSGSSRGLDVHFGDGAGGRRDKSLVAGEGQAQSLVLSDFDTDGHLDAIVGFSGTLGIVPYLGDGRGGFSPRPGAAVDGPATGVVLDDFDGDGIADVAAHSRGLVVTYRGDGAGGFVGPPPAFPANPPGEMAAADIDGDGTREILVAASGLFVYRPDAAGTPELESRFGAPASGEPAIVDDFDRDGSLDAAVAGSSELGIVTILFGDGAGGFDASSSFAAGQRIRRFAASDFDSDGAIDLALALSSERVVVFLRQDGEGRLVEGSRVALERAADSMTAADVDGDGDADLAIGDFRGLSVYEGTGAFSFEPPRSIRIPELPYGLTPRDLDGDGADELLFTLWQGSGLVVYSDSDGTRRTYDAGYRPVRLSLADFDGDGRSDVAAVSDFGFHAAVFLGAEGTRLAPAVSSATDERIYRVVGVDLNGDGLDDLVTLSERFTVFANLGSDCGRGTVNAGAGTPSDVLSADGSTGLRKRVHVVSADSPVEIALAASPAGPASARYVLYAWDGWPQRAVRVALGADSLGCSVGPTPLVRPAGPQPRYCLASSFIPPATVVGVRRLAASPERAPWALHRRSGFRRGTVFTLQGLLEDAGSASPLGFSVTNALTLVAR